ncbi:hypothetical protein CENSYa_0244 [Cenarchaeum symbiosum A]|uniref:Uncharacterized protein n=1 Tax=Cenarchaeum symbiosum (strain A) TaxID=414004 RepID=A0RU69_CENSY|nr:hypothetical protein CENSYa_0244 [Cenarchaeum symbiosum A]
MQHNQSQPDEAYKLKVLFNLDHSARCVFIYIFLCPKLYCECGYVESKSHLGHIVLTCKNSVSVMEEPRELDLYPVLSFIRMIEDSLIELSGKAYEHMLPNCPRCPA